MVRWNGRLLASRVDPVGEARQWLESRRTFLDRVQAVFILGAGSGFHIREVLKATEARVIVIEAKSEIVEELRPRFADVAARLRFVSVQAAREARGSEFVREGLKDSFIVLEHPASMATDPDFYAECGQFLRARDWGALTWQWKLKGHPSLDSEPKIAKMDEPLSLLDLEQTELVQNSEERERLLVLALRELIK